MACAVMREILGATQKVAEWEFDKDPTIPRSFPEVPFELLRQCGSPSFGMPFPYVFTFDENPLDAQSYMDIFLAKNKTVAHRVSGEEAKINYLFGFYLQELASLVWAPFETVWNCISAGECVLYFDNSWSPDDFRQVLGEDASDVLTSASDFGSMFLSNYDEYRLTASTHAAPFKSLVTQMTAYKDWVFMDPAVYKKYLPVETESAITVIAPMSQNQDDIFSRIPRYNVRTNAGQGVYFPEFWLHTVTTAPGINLMANWRQSPTLIDNFITSPHKWKNRMKIVMLLFMKEYIVPDWLSKALIGNGQEYIVESKRQKRMRALSMLKLNN